LSRQQRLTTWMAAAAVMIGSLGVPHSTQRAVRSGEAFPCQNCACGCSDAATCWRDCCCFTNAQKIVWAEKNGVKVPLYVTVAARREQASAAETPACCLNQMASDSCDSSCSSDANEVCTEPSCCQKRSHSSSDSERKVVLLMSALKCRGISVSIGWLPPSLPPALPALDATVVDLGPLHAEPASLYRSPCDDVATPPPDACQLS
jgi:hypothetical protein